MLGRWVQNRTNDFNGSVTGDSDQPITLEGARSKRRMQFVFGWVKKMVKGSRQYKELMEKNPPT